MENKRKTKQKEMIIQYLENNKSIHLTIQDIVDGLNEEIGTTTIYRMIHVLIEEGIVNKIPLTSKQGYCYQYNPKDIKCKNHYHLICEDCGCLSHFESKTLEKTQEEALDKEDFNIDTSKIVFYGKCKKCNCGGKIDEN